MRVTRSKGMAIIRKFMIAREKESGVLTIKSNHMLSFQKKLQCPWMRACTIRVSEMEWNVTLAPRVEGGSKT